MYKIRTYNQISDIGLNRFPMDSYEIGPDVADPDAFILRSQKLHDEPVPDSLLAVARAGAGVNNIPVEDYTRRGIVVFNTPGANANAVKEMVAVALLLGSRRILDGVNRVQELTDISDPEAMAKQLEKEKKRFGGSEIAGKTLGVVGLGAIGSMVANMALEMGMHVAGYDPALSVEAAWRLSSQVEKMESLETLLKISDFVTLHVPSIEQTRHLISTTALLRFKPGARLLNFAREEIVDAAAVIAALDEGRLGGYITDFPLPELLGRPDCLLFPHLGASTAEAEENCSVMAAEQLMDFLQNGNIFNSVNYPRTRMGRNGGYRITFANENVPRVLGHVLSVLADHDINVIDMVNKSLRDMAYNIIDVETRPKPEIIDAIVSVDGVMHVRVI
ncbi:MAG: phosphoglycerate dehydrogenase [Xanthomonadales bacterium]|nr:phosphoglycerate dehydrogenase [Gammaproteobacteria bacterium]MBT8053975.1 phosphoglycerate dehydrogenase [Gammaproteobacteria bacterium]NND58316.1 phosphoglycerate dehydrogenase [Xanthomonadales bacterium]NNK51973.1 phosphoglycerate dehydrogenase [Xanthomonadales bacterium]